MDARTGGGFAPGETSHGARGSGLVHGPSPRPGRPRGATRPGFRHRPVRHRALVRHWRLNGIWVLWSCVGLAACQADGCTQPKEAKAPGRDQPVPTSDSGEVNPFHLDVSAYDFARRPQLLERIRSDPHGFFRFVNRQFSQTVCDRFADLVRILPSVNLHGDAHLEQYAVTEKSRGLTDFDDSTTGPAVIDLMRLGVSISLATRLEGWEADTDPLFDRFLDGYRASLKDPEAKAPVPSLVQSVRKSFPEGSEDFFQWVQSVVEPLEPDKLRELEAALQPYVDRMVALDENDARTPEYFEVQMAGLLKLGIGSALDEKYVVQVRGPTDRPDDDVVLELKEVRDLRGVTCIEGTEKIDPFRILVGQSRIAYAPYRYLGYIRHDGRTFWIHSWVVNYREMDLSSMLTSKQHLEEVLYDVGIQLGRGHPYQIAAPLDEELRRELRRFVSREHDRLHVEIHALTEEIMAGWKRFNRDSDRQVPAEKEGESLE